MTVVTRGIILSRDIDIATCQNRDLTRGNTKNLQKKIKKRESDTWHAVNGVNYFFLKGTLMHFFKSGDAIDTFFPAGTKLTPSYQSGYHPSN